jgi:hypothetical protein
LSRCGIPQANSTTSRPRVTSPSASESTLPCSSVMIAASSSLRSFSSSRKLNRTCVRRVIEVVPHSANAVFAAATASSMIRIEAKSTVPLTWPVAGS